MPKSLKELTLHPENSLNFSLIFDEHIDLNSLSSICFTSQLEVWALDNERKYGCVFIREEGRGRGRKGEGDCIQSWVHRMSSSCLISNTLCLHYSVLTSLVISTTKFICGLFFRVEESNCYEYVIITGHVILSLLC